MGIAIFGHRDNQFIWADQALIVIALVRTFSDHQIRRTKKKKTLKKIVIDTRPEK